MPQGCLLERLLNSPKLALGDRVRLLDRSASVLEIDKQFAGSTL